MPHLWIIAILVFTVSCASQKSSEKMPSANVREELGREIRLSDDNKELNNLRKSLPEQKRQDNDDLAAYLNKLQLAERDPDRARSEFTQLVQGRRERFREKMSKIRLDYSSEERSRRELFNQQQNKKREEIRGRKLKARDSQEAYLKLSEEQKDFYAHERLRRKDFEAEVQSQMKDFDFMIRERQQAFNEQLRMMKKKESHAPIVPLSTED